MSFISSNLFHFQIELDKTAEEFRKAHFDRQSLISQWEATIEQMRRRDAAMDVAATVSCEMTDSYLLDI